MSVPPGAFDAEGLPDHLRLRLRVVDEEGREVAAGRDADDLLRRLGRSAQQSFARLAGESSARRGVVRFDFGELPQRVDLPGGAAGHPALLDRGDSVELSVLSSAPAAEAATRLGLRRLFLLQVADELRELLDWLPGLDELERLYAPLGPAAELREAVSLLVAERAFLGDGVWPRRAADLERRLEERRPALWPHTEDVLDLTGRILRARQEVASKLAELREPAVCAAAEDLRRHVRELVPPRFPALIPYARLQHVPRYLQADLRRLERLRGGLERDGARLGELQPLLEQWHRRRADHERRFIDDPALEEYRWMLEEMRVSLFAQELGTACPVSSRRLAAQWALVQG
jgi:ATP-dependent helicase HrpA